MIYLGIHNSYQAGAALIIDGQVIGAVTEERFNRVKIIYARRFIVDLINRQNRP